MGARAAARSAGRIRWIAVASLAAALIVGAIWWSVRQRRASDGIAAAPAPDVELGSAAPAVSMPAVEPRAEPVRPGPVEREAQPASSVETPAPERFWWPELLLAVRDEHTRADLADIELCCIPNVYMRGGWRRPGVGAPYTSLGDGLTSPIVLRPGRPASGGDEYVHGLGARPAAGPELEFATLDGRVPPERGVVVWARTPTHAWGRIELDVSAGGERELLLPPAAALHVRLANVQLEGYAACEEPAVLYVMRSDRGRGERAVWRQGLGSTLAEEGAHFAGIEPGAYTLSVELGDPGNWRPRVVLASEALQLAAAEEREVLLTLDDPPVPRARATLAGTLSFPSFPLEDEVVLRLYDAATYSQGDADAELPIAALERVGGARPTWSFRVEDLRAGRYQAKVWPFLKSWMIDLPPEGVLDVELELTELAQVVVETVDGRTGERVPLNSLRYAFEEILTDQVNHLSEDAPLDGEPGRFRFWTAPGEGSLSTDDLPPELGYGDRWITLPFVAGYQEVAFELEPVCAIRIVFRDGEAVLPRGDAVYENLEQGIRALEHDGRVTHIKLATEKLVEVTKAGPYEISFEGVGADRYLPIPTERVDVRPGETAEVIVELRRK